MLIDKVILVRVSNRTKKYFLSKGYLDIDGYFNVYPKDMNDSNRTKVRCGCKYCGVINEISWSNYIVQMNKNNIYSCHKCHFNKSKIQFIKNYGIDNPQSISYIRDKLKNTCLLKYGFDNAMKNINVKNKAKNTFISRYVVDHPMKFEKFFDKAQKSSYKHFIYESSDLKYQGSYELDFIKICLHNNLNIKNGPVIDYTMSDKSRKYYSDFYLPDFNLICEIKSTYTFNCDYDENIAKQKFAIKSGYNFIFIIDKKYNEFENITCKNSL